MKTKERIELTDSPMQMIVKMSEGNPGAATVLVQIFKDNESIDPDSAFGPFSAMLGLDSFGVYGSNIWVLYKDICGNSIPNVVGVLRAVQLGFLGIDELHGSLCSGKLEIEPLLLQVKERLPRFNP